MWTIEYSEKAAGELLKIDRQAAKRIKKYLDERIATDEDPRRFGEGLTENLAGLWKYRIGDYRLICSIEDEKLVILALSVGHRSEIYKQ